MVNTSNRSILLKCCPNSKQRRIHDNSLLLVGHDELGELEKNYKVTYDPLLENYRLSVLLTDRLIQFVDCCYLEEVRRKTIVLQKKYSNDTPEEIFRRLQDCRPWMIKRIVTKKLQKYYPSDVVDCAMAVYNCQNKMYSKATHDKLYRKLQEAIFKHQGTVGQRLLIQTKANFRSQIEAQIQQELSNEELQRLLSLHTDCIDIIAEYRLTEHQLGKLSRAELSEYLNRKNMVIDSRIVERLRKIGNIGNKGTKVSNKDSFFWDCFIDEFSSKLVKNKEERGQLIPQYSLKYINKSYGIEQGNEHLLSADIREENVRILALRPELPVYFDRMGRAHLRRTEI